MVYLTLPKEGREEYDQESLSLVYDKYEYIRVTLR